MRVQRIVQMHGSTLRRVRYFIFSPAISPMPAGQVGAIAAPHLPCPFLQILVQVALQDIGQLTDARAAAAGGGRRMNGWRTRQRCKSICSSS